MKNNLLLCSFFAISVQLWSNRVQATTNSLQLVSTIDPSQGPPAGGNGDSIAPVISPNGRYVAFASAANNLILNSQGNSIPAVFPARLNVYVRDRTNGVTTLVSLDLSGVGGGNGDSFPTGISDDGRYILFESWASNLIPNDTNNTSDIFLRDLATDTTRLVSANTNGGVGNGQSRSAVITPDGRYVAFVSAASDLVPGDTNRIADVFVRDLQLGTTTLVSVGAVSPGTGFAVFGSDSPLITPDGRYVAFFSTATNLIFGPGSSGDIYVRDLALGQTIWASSGALAAAQTALRATNTASFNHAISSDGQFVAYEAGCSPRFYPSRSGVILRFNLQTGFTDVIHTNAFVCNSSYEDIRSLSMTPDGRSIAFVANVQGDRSPNTCIFVWNADAGSNVLASADPSGQIDPTGLCNWPVLDPAGRYVAFLSSATNLVSNSLTGEYHLYVRDLQAGVTSLVDSDMNGVGSILGPATIPVLSGDAGFVAFDCPDGNLVTNDRNRAYDVFVRDLNIATNELISAREATLASITPNGHSTVSAAGISADAHFIAFSSEADNLAPNDNNGRADVFVRDLWLGTNILVSVDTNGFSADGSSVEAAISGDGLHVAFTSAADNLVAGDNNRTWDVFLRDLQMGTTILVSVSMNGINPGGAASRSPLVSADGRYVVFLSKAINLTTNSFNAGTENLFLRDVVAGTTYALSTGGAIAFAMTPDGHFVGFAGGVGSTLINLYVWDSLAATWVRTNSLPTTLSTDTMSISADGRYLALRDNLTIHLWDMASNILRTVASSTYGTHPGVRLSGDGRSLVFATLAAIAPSDVNGNFDVYYYDTQTSSNFLVSRNYAGVSASGASDSPDISYDGRFVAYRSMAGDIVPGDTNGVADIFLFDRVSGATTLLSASRFGGHSSDNLSCTPRFSPDGTILVFQTWASDQVQQDFNANSDIVTMNLYSSSQIPLIIATIFPDPVVPQVCWVTWPVQPGRTYKVQFRDNFLADWNDTASGPTILGSQGYFRDLTSANTTRFYRIVAF
jgi:Tol biopolymer transport system component